MDLHKLGFFILWMLYGTTQAQECKISLSGKILDEATRVPLNNVKIIIQEKNIFSNKTVGIQIKNFWHLQANIFCLEGVLAMNLNYLKISIKILDSRKYFQSFLP